MKTWITVSVAQVHGSTPRDTDAQMRVFAEGQEGTIGGGALEWEAAKIARQMLIDGQETAQRTMPLGPNLGQCCGGTVVLNFEANAQTLDIQGTPLWIWGAGHVGRAISNIMAPLPQFDLTLVDFDAARLPKDLPHNVTPLLGIDPVRLVPHAPQKARHIIVTHDHKLDLELCHALLSHGFSSCGLIGSATKWVRFQKRLKAFGHAENIVKQIICPIGNPALGKHPTEIAVGVAAELLTYENKAALDRITETRGEIAS